jgi:hypothetical protein
LAAWADWTERRAAMEPARMRVDVRVREVLVVFRGGELMAWVFWWGGVMGLNS